MRSTRSPDKRSSGAAGSMKSDPRSAESRMRARKARIEEDRRDPRTLPVTPAPSPKQASEGPLARVEPSPGTLGRRFDISPGGAGEAVVRRSWYPTLRLL